jgi:hypothetical protein
MQEMATVGEKRELAGKKATKDGVSGIKRTDV